MDEARKLAVLPIEAIPGDSNLENLSMVASGLVEAASFARDGDCETARAFIARAMALLRGEPSTIPTGAPPPNHGAPEVLPGGFAARRKRRVTVYIDTHLAGRIRVEELARLLNLSESHFSRAFRCAFGTSAHDYRTRRRIEMAQGLMLTSAETLCAIALRCGLSDQSHFTRLFRRIVGETPYAWRRRRRGEFEERSTARLLDSAERAN
jgi:AraC-like DNA-binding protein